MELPIPRRSYTRSQWRISPLLLLTTLFSIGFLLAVINSFFLLQIDAKGCKLPYMRPILAKLDAFNSKHSRLATKYSLYLYREYGLNSDQSVQGTPVLFVPGNAGSYKQVRSLAAQAAQYYAERFRPGAGSRTGRSVKDLDFFAADFNEDFTAFHGQTLLDQAEYLNEAIAFILSLYKDPHGPHRSPGEADPESVLVIGHSMGGIVARTMPMLPNYRPESMNTIITISSPHARAPIAFDSLIVDTYNKINGHWRKAFAFSEPGESSLRQMTIISIVGGGLDTTVPSDYTTMASFLPQTHGFTVYTSSIPHVWTGADHLSVLWCDQVRRSIITALYEIVDARNPGQTTSIEDRMRVFRRTFLTGLERERNEDPITDGRPEHLLLNRETLSVLDPMERLILKAPGDKGRSHVYLLPIPSGQVPSKAHFFFLSDQQPASPDVPGALKILLCGEVSESSDESKSSGGRGPTMGPAPITIDCEHAGSDVKALPASTSESRYPFEDRAPFWFLQQHADSLSPYKYVAVVDSGSTPQAGWAVAEFATESQSFVNVDRGIKSTLGRGIKLSLPKDRALVTTIHFQAIHSALLAFKLTLDGSNYEDEKSLFRPLLRQSVSDPYESKYFVNIKRADINLHGIAPFVPALLDYNAEAETLYLQLWADPAHDGPSQLSLQLDLVGSLGKLVMRYRTVIPAIPLVIVALVIREQLNQYDQTGNLMSFFDALNLCTRTTLPIFFIVMTLLSFFLASSHPHPGGSDAPRAFWLANSTNAARYSTNNLLLGSQDPFFWFLVPLFGIVGVGLCVVINYLALLLVQIVSQAQAALGHLGTFRNNGRRDTSPATSVQSLGSSRQRLAVGAALLLFLLTFIPYQLVYVLVCIFQITSCSRSLSHATKTRLDPLFDFSNHNHSILVLMLWVLPINIPVLVVWTRNLMVHFSTSFSPFHNVISVAPFLILANVLSVGTRIPRLKPRWGNVTSVLFFALAIYAATYGVTFAYRLHQIANLICLWLVCVHYGARPLGLCVDGGGADNLAVDQDRFKKRP